MWLVDGWCWVFCGVIVLWCFWSGWVVDGLVWCEGLWFCNSVVADSVLFCVRMLYLVAWVFLACFGFGCLTCWRVLGLRGFAAWLVLCVWMGVVWLLWVAGCDTVW